MNKILLASILLGAGGGAFLTARQSAIQLQHQASLTGEAWLVQTQRVAVAQGEQAGLIERVRELKQGFAQLQPVAENAVWSALQTHGAGRLPPELREHLLEELGFNWQSSEDFIVVSKDALREIRIAAIRDGKLTDNAATVLALTPGERGQIEAVMQQVQTDFNAWALAHTERTEPRDDVVAQYTLLNDPAMTVSNKFAARLSDAVGQERAGLILPSAREWMRDIGVREEPATMIVKRYSAGNEQRLKVQMFWSFGTRDQSGETYPRSLSQRPFPRAFLPMFPNGWADVAKREGIELPAEEPQEK